MDRRIIVILISGLLLFGCNGTVDTEQPQEQVEENETTEDVTENQTEENVSEDMETDDAEPAPVEGEKVLIMGRSVAYHWMEYLGFEWTCDDEECATGSPRGNYDDYYFIYYELEYPPEIATSAADGVDMYGTDAEVVFFKFCFVDFAADDTLQNAYDNEELAEDVYQYVVVDRGKKLIIGNALPQVSGDTEPALVENHKEFNTWLDNFASTHDNVQVLDLNGILADSSGNLKEEYAVSSNDSHLTEAAYDEIMPEFMALLEKA